MGDAEGGPATLPGPRLNPSQDSENDRGSHHAVARAGNTFTNQGDSQRNFVMHDGHQNRQFNSPGVYHEGPANYTYQTILPARAKTPPQPSSNVPFHRNPDFIERPALTAQIQAKLADPQSKAALVGLGGVGKTQLAVEYARQLRKQSPQTWVFWIHAGNAARFGESMRSIAELLEIDIQQIPTANVLVLVRNWLRKATNGSWLIVLDNADDISFLLEWPPDSPLETASIKRPIDCFPVCDHGSILVTSRSRNEALREYVYDSEIIGVQPMNEDEAAALFAKTIGRSDPDDRALVQALDCLPLAISQAAAYIRERCSVQQYRELLEKSSRSRVSLLRREVPLPSRYADASNSVLLTWQVSFEHIIAARKSAADLLSFMSFCDRNAIPKILLRPLDQQGEERRGSSMDLEDSFQDDIVMLQSFAFITVAVDQQTWAMHRLVQDATQLWLHDRGHYEPSLDRFIHRLQWSFPEPDFENWPNCSILFPHAKNAVEHKPTGAKPQSYWASILYKSASYAIQQGDQHGAHILALASLKARTAQLGDANRLTLKSKAQVAEIDRRRGRVVEAGELQKTVVETSRRVFGERNWFTMEMMAVLERIYTDGGRYKEAEELLLTIAENPSNESDEWAPVATTWKASLGAIYYHQGRYDEAEELVKEVFETLKKKLGEGHPIVAERTRLLARIYHATGRLKEAEALYSQAIDISSKIRAKDPLLQADIACLADCYERQGLSEKAEMLLRHAIAMQRQLVGDDHRDTLDSMLSLAVALRNQGRLLEARDLAATTVESQLRVLGENHPRMYWSRSTLNDIEARIQHQNAIEVDQRDTTSAEARPRWKKIKRLFSSKHRHDAHRR